MQMGAIKAPQTEKPEPWQFCDLDQAALFLSPALPELSSLSCVISWSQITLKTSRSFAALPFPLRSACATFSVIYSF